jgi:hypothetical protein
LNSYEKSLEIQIKITGTESNEVSSILNDIGCIYKKRGEYQKALENYEKILVIQKQT